MTVREEAGKKKNSLSERVVCPAVLIIIDINPPIWRTSVFSIRYNWLRVKYIPHRCEVCIRMPSSKYTKTQLGERRWRRGSVGDITADSGEGYATKDGVRNAVKSLKKNAPDAETEEK